MSRNANERFWYIDTDSKSDESNFNQRMAVVERDTNANKREGVNSDWVAITEAKNLIIQGIVIDVDLEDLSHSSAFKRIPDRFHQVIAYKAISDLYKDPRNLNMEMAQFFEGEFEKGVKRGKVAARTNLVKTGVIKQVDF